MLFSKLPAVLTLFLFAPLAAIASAQFPFTDFRSPDFFPILTWDPLHGWDGQTKDSETNGLTSISACHFNFAGFVQVCDLAQCKRFGLAAILLPEGPSVMPLTFQTQWQTLS